eukprot:TRINITY_DN212_c0_g1_i1.p1 TRINITY_DN212_c0_g1~~TRINITY_DN212_c0_g1_i1.p1  ORF type:complete len:114 (-),score=7.88 TRINITY_DN212_c0_g1_i1:59-400(-)
MCDFGSTDVNTVVDDCLAFIDRVREENARILIQCEWGINRSVTATVMWLVARAGFSLRDALKLCYAKRSQSRPRDAYIQQLQTLERQWRPDADDYLDMSEVAGIFNETPLPQE